MFEKFRKNAAVARLVEERLYGIVAAELANGEIREGLWAKALADSKGAEEAAKGLYMKYRVQSMRDDVSIAISERKGIEAAESANINAKTERNGIEAAEIAEINAKTERLEAASERVEIERIEAARQRVEKAKAEAAMVKLEQEITNINAKTERKSIEAAEIAEINAKTERVEAARLATDVQGPEHETWQIKQNLKARGYHIIRNISSWTVIMPLGGVQTIHSIEVLKEFAKTTRPGES